jgi:hypothetical protein
LNAGEGVIFNRNAVNVPPTLAGGGDRERRDYGGARPRDGGSVNYGYPELTPFSLPSTLQQQQQQQQQRINLVSTISVFLPHFLPSKLCTTYSYAQVKFEKNEWCHTKKKNH